MLLLIASALSEDGPPHASLCTVDHSLPRETPAGEAVSQPVYFFSSSTEVVYVYLSRRMVATGCFLLITSCMMCVLADVRRRQQRVAEVAELIHVASLLHDDVLDNASTR